MCLPILPILGAVAGIGSAGAAIAGFSTAATVLSGVAAGAGLVGQLVGASNQADALQAQGLQQQQAANAQATQLDLERQQKQATAQASLDQAEVKAGKLLRQGGVDLSQQPADYAQMGVRVGAGSGSPEDAQIELQRRILEDAANAKLEGVRIRTSYDITGQQLGVAAADARQTGVNAVTNANAQADATALTGSVGALTSATNWITANGSNLFPKAAPIVNHAVTVP
ncbi:MAG: hypothetical protein HYX63_01595 [Gammaproteobacteria bacterium]|nr:hypothetical protein [Gammaproteobacteria bacterium]